MLSKVTITEKEVTREGIAFLFTGQEEDANGDPVSEFVSIELVVPPLNLDSLRIMQPKLQKLQTDPDVESMNTMVDAIAHALKRNYRGIPRWLIEQTLDIGNMPALTQAFMDIGGLKRKEIEAGKATAAAKNPPTGMPSTAS